MAKDDKTGAEQSTDPNAPEGVTGARTDADVLAETAQATGVPLPPQVMPDQVLGTSSRLNAGRDNFNQGRDRANITRLVYWGRKDQYGDVMEDQVRGEHIDVTVPDPERNRRRVELLRSRIPQGNLTDDDKTKAGLDMMTGDELHTRGQHYHFEQGQATDAYNEDVEWLKTHKTYHITEAPQQAQQAT